jgi:type VI secretion system protein ImpH
LKEIVLPPDAKERDARPDNPRDADRRFPLRARIVGYWMGLTGPMGPLPPHITQTAVVEARMPRRRPLARFLDMISGRFLQLFYAAWRETTPTALADRPKEDHFGAYIAKLSGAQEGVAKDGPFTAEHRLAYAGLFASRRSPAAIEDAISHLLEIPVALSEYEPRVRTIEPEDRSRLGGPFNTLGQDAVLGQQIVTVSDGFRLTIKARSLREYEQLLPGGRTFALAADALDAFAPSHLEWDIALGIEASDAHGVQLDGRSRLGWSSWVGEDLGQLARADAHLGRGARRLARAQGGEGRTG